MVFIGASVGVMLEIVKPTSGAEISAGPLASLARLITLLTSSQRDRLEGRTRHLADSVSPAIASAVRT